MARVKSGSVKKTTTLLVTSVDLASADVTGVLAVANGGTGQGSYTDGQLLIGNTTGNTLTKATLTQGEGVLITNGAGSITVAQGYKSISAKTADYTLADTDKNTVLQFSAGAWTLSLPAAASLTTGLRVWVWNLGSLSSYTVTIDPNGSETIDSLTTMTLYRGEGVEIINTGSNWRTLAPKKYRCISENFDSTDVRPVASGDKSMALGAASTASNDYSFAMGQDSGGIGSAASGIGSLAVMGGAADALDSFASGPASTTRSNRGAWARASGKITTVGDTQIRDLVMRGQTTDATPKVLTTDNATVATANIIRMPNNSAYTFIIMVTGHRTDSVGTYASYIFQGLITRGANAASTTIRGTVSKTIVFETDSAYDCDVTADTTNGGGIVTVTGKAAHTVTWSARIMLSEATS